MALAYPGYRGPDLEHRTRTAVAGAALLHGAVIAVLIALASVAPKDEDRILHLQILQPEPEPEPPVVVAPKPEPPPKPVHIELPKPKPAPQPPPPAPPKAPEPAPAPPKPKPIVKPAPLAPEPIAAPVPAPARAARPAPARRSAVRVPAAQIDRMIARPEFPEAGPVAERRPVVTSRAERSAPPPPARIDRVAVARPEAVLAPPAERAAPPPLPLRAERPAATPHAAPPAPRDRLRGVALSELLPCVSDARELALKQETVAAARNLPLCESPAGRFHFLETKNVNAFLMRIEQSAGRRSGDRCEELKLALECIASRPPTRSGR